MHFCGYGVPQDYNKAMEFHVKAASLGDVYAQFTIGIDHFIYLFLTDYICFNRRNV